MKSSRRPLERDAESKWRKQHRSWLLEIAKTLHGYRCEWIRKKGVWRISVDGRLVAEWPEDRVPGLGEHLSLQLIDFQMLAIAVLLQRETSRAGGRKTVKRRREGETKTDRILKALAAQPDADTRALAERFQCDVSLVRKLRVRQAKSDSQ